MCVLGCFESLKYAARRELLLMPAFTVPDNLPPLRSKPVDTVSVMYLQSLGLYIGTPLRVNADGNCLFNSISTLLYGHEDKARELRVRTCIQMCNNMDRYLSSPDAGNILLLSPTFEPGRLPRLRYRFSMVISLKYYGSSRRNRTFHQDSLPTNVW